MADYQLYDMHSHILPGVDDGARTVEDSVALLNALKEQGVNNVCLTPHFYTHHKSVEKFAQKRQEAFELLKPHIPEGMRVVLGSEVYVTRYLLSNNDWTPMCYGKSRYVLTEHSYGAHFSEKTMGYFQKFAERKMIPVMPHIERYETLMNDIDIVRQLHSLGTVMQVNACSLTKKAPFFQKRKLLKMISEGIIDILGTDAHSFDHNTPYAYSEACELIKNKCGEDRLIGMMKKSEKIFESAL